MPDDLEAVLRLVAEGRLTAEEASPIVAALEEQARLDAGGPAQTPSGESPEQGRDGGRRGASVQDAMAGRRLRVYVAQKGRPVVNIAIPLSTAGFAIDQLPGLSPGHRSRIVEAIQSGAKGPIVEVSDGGDEVLIAIE